jgi:hypothetical protein
MITSTVCIFRFFLIVFLKAVNAPPLAFFSASLSHHRLGLMVSHHRRALKNACKEHGIGEGGGVHSSHRQLLRYEKDGPELYCFAQNNNILKNNLCTKIRLRALKSIQSFPIS